MFWIYIPPGHVAWYLIQWFWWATHSRIEPLRDFVWMLRRHWDGVMAWTRTRTSNSALEGMNNKIMFLSNLKFP